MANPEHVKELLKGVEHWNEWYAQQREKDPKFQADLSEFDIRTPEFRKSTLNIDTISSGANFRGIHLEGANLNLTHLERATLSFVHLENARLIGAHLEGANLFEAHLEGANLRGAHLDNCNFNSTDLSNAELIGVHYNGQSFLRTLAAKGGTLIQTWIKKRNLHQSRFKRHFLGKITALRRINASLYKFSVRNGLRLRHIAQEPTSSYKGIRVGTCHGNQRFRRYAMDQAYLEELRDSHLPWERWVYKLWLYSSDCGRSLTLWAFWSLLLAMLFGCIYWLMPTQFHVERLPAKEFWTFLYYSVVTFTTLGFGDIVPKTGLAAFFVILEVIFGYVMLGGLISIFANKLARRSG